MIFDRSLVFTIVNLTLNGIPLPDHNGQYLWTHGWHVCVFKSAAYSCIAGSHVLPESTRLVAYC